MYKITFKDTSYYMASDSFIENVSKKWHVLTKVERVDKID